MINDDVSLTLRGGRPATKSFEKVDRPMAIDIPKFWAMVEKGNDCWLWLGSKRGKGYGQIYIGIINGRKRQTYAHRVSWEIANGQSIPDGLEVLHRCDTPLCVRPEHLFLGTQKDNLDDCLKKGRHVRGDRRKDSKLTTADVLEIRRRYRPRLATSLSVQFKVSEHTIRNIAHGRTWAWLTNEQ